MWAESAHWEQLPKRTSKWTREHKEVMKAFTLEFLNLSHLLNKNQVCKCTTNRKNTQDQTKNTRTLRRCKIPSQLTHNFQQSYHGLQGINLCYILYGQRATANFLRDSILVYFSVFTYWMNKDCCNGQRFQFSPKSIAVTVLQVEWSNKCQLRSVDAD